MRINKSHWGYADEKEAFLFEIEHESGMRACVSNFGGVLKSLYVHDAEGELMDVVLGYDSLEQYRNSETFFGAMVGPVADRLRDGRCRLDGRDVQLPLNAGPDTMHSGPKGFHAKVWDWELLPDGVCFHLEICEGESGFPGMLKVRLAYRIPEEGKLRLEYHASCDRETAVSFTNHSYFNVDGCRNSCREQRLTVNASRFAQTERECDPICTGRACYVESTPFDLRRGCRLSDVLSCTDFRELRTAGGIDHYFLVDGEGMREHARLESMKSGISMTCLSDAPGVLVYTGNGLEKETGKSGCVYERNWGVCLETERFPNGINIPEWSSQVLLPAGVIYESATEFMFQTC